MIVNNPYVVVAILFTHLHSTNQTYSHFCHNSYLVKRRLLKEKPGLLSTLVDAINLCTPPPYDLACDELTPYEKQQTCDQAMREMVAKERYIIANQPNRRNIRVGSFLDGVNSNLAVPELADPSDPYACKEIPIEEMGYKKRMFWCKNRVFTVEGSDATDQAEGFFVSGSEKLTNRIFIFKPSPTNSRKVTPKAMMRSVRVLAEAHHHCTLRSMVSASTSATVTPISE